MATEHSGVVAVTVPANIPLPHPEGANFFHFTVVGEDIQLLVGSVNLLSLHEAKGRAEPTKIVPDISHRFLLSPVGFSMLKRQIEEIAKAVPQSSVSSSREAKQ